MRLNDKVAIVTGGASGIGRATAELFAREGATVYAADLGDPGFATGGPVWLEHDVTSLGSWEQAVERVTSEDETIDVLMNNAGAVGSYDSLVDIDVDRWHAVISLNQTAVFYGMRSVIPKMLEVGRGSVINVSSIWGIVGAAGVSAYQASKGAVRLMSKNAAMTYAERGVRVNSLHPGIIATPMIAGQAAEITAAIVDATPMKRQGLPEEVAAGALFLASDESSFMTGAELVIDGGYTAQ
jgi:NAD(P)-dependent dehydrogenase (short-subunit alcohol dehydrogenase family)